MTNSDYITAALQMLGVLAETESPSAEQGAQAMGVLNDMLALWAERGIDIGWNASTSPTDTIDFHPAARQAVKAGLAMALAPYYERQPSIMLAQAAESGYHRLLSAAVNAKIENLPFLHIPRSEGGQGIWNPTSGQIV